MRAGAAGGGRFAGPGPGSREPGGGPAPAPAHRRWPGDACRRQQNAALPAVRCPSPACPCHPLPVPCLSLPAPAWAPPDTGRAPSRGSGRRGAGGGQAGDGGTGPGSGGSAGACGGATARGPAPAPRRLRGGVGASPGPGPAAPAPRCPRPGLGSRRGRLGAGAGVTPPQHSTAPGRGGSRDEATVPRWQGARGDWESPGLVTAEAPLEKPALGPAGNPLPGRGGRKGQGDFPPCSSPPPRAPLPWQIPAQRLPPPTGPGHCRWHCHGPDTLAPPGLAPCRAAQGQGLATPGAVQQPPTLGLAEEALRGPRSRMVPGCGAAAHGVSTAELDVRGSTSWFCQGWKLLPTRPQAPAQA